ncbi:hypothetical protein [Kitasatospora sp. NPDC057223]|uniref:hypothetical protein n=1 Tax=Kitasatospora sp. NPDC057223 TaxID=3346055 RepID=UPI00363B6A4C
MHHVVVLSGLAALVLALWALQLTVLALHVRFAIHNGVSRGLSDDVEFGLLVVCAIVTLGSAIGGGSAIGASLNATQWGWAHAILAAGVTVSYLLLTYATEWDAETWWEKRKTRRTGHTAEATEAVEAAEAAEATA